MKCSVCLSNTDSFITGYVYPASVAAKGSVPICICSGCLGKMTNSLKNKYVEESKTDEFGGAWATATDES